MYKTPFIWMHRSIRYHLDVLRAVQVEMPIEKDKLSPDVAPRGRSIKGHHENIIVLETGNAKMKKLKKSKALEARTFNVPLVVPAGYREFLGSLKLQASERRALVGLYKEISISCIRQIQREINEGCRVRGNILHDVLEGKLEDRPSGSIAHYRKIFQDSSKVGEVSTYLVKNTLLGQHEHLNSKFKPLRKLFTGCTLAEVASFITCNYLENGLRQQISARFDWKLAHVRSQLRGIRRMMESTEGFDPALRMTSKNGEFAKLREAIDSLLREHGYPGGLNPIILEKVLNAFQRWHVLHVLLLSDQPVHGLYPKKMICEDGVHAAGQITAQVQLFQVFCRKNREAIEKLVANTITGMVSVSLDGVKRAVTGAIAAHEKYMDFLRRNRHGLHHASKKKRALEALQADQAWAEYIKCGAIPSERYLKGLHKLIAGMPGKAHKLEDALHAIIPFAHVSKLVSMRGSTARQFIGEFFATFTADTGTTVPYTSPKNRKELSPIDLTPLNHEFLIIRPGKTSQDLLDQYLRRGRPIPLRIAPGVVFTHFTGGPRRSMDESTLKRHVLKKLTRKNHAPGVIEKILGLISFDTVTSISVRTLESRLEKLSPLARFLLTPTLEVNIFTNTRLENQLEKVREIVRCPDCELAPVRILPASSTNNSCTCQLIFKSSKLVEAFMPSIRFMEGVPIGKYNEDERIGVDRNQEGPHVLYIAPDWESTARYIKQHDLEKKLGRPVYNEDRDKSFTAYVHDGETSERVSNRVNALSRELKQNTKHLKTLKKTYRKVQGAHGVLKLNTVSLATEFYETATALAGVHALPEAADMRDIARKIRSKPDVHQLRGLRANRRAVIQRVIDALEKLGLAGSKELRLTSGRIDEKGKHLHRLETEMNRIQNCMNKRRKTITNLQGQLNAMVICEKHPAELVYEELHLKNQGLKGQLGEITKYMSSTDEMFIQAALIANRHALSKGKVLKTKMRAKHPGGTSSPPHIPTGLDFNRGGKNGWNSIRIPATKKDGINYPDLTINSHVLSCQKICEGS